MHRFGHYGVGALTAAGLAIAAPAIPAASCPTDQASYVTKVADGVTPRGIHLDRMAWVAVDVRLDDRGRVVDAKSERSADPLLDGAAEAAARRSTFKPAVMGCKRAWSESLVTIFFEPN